MPNKQQILDFIRSHPHMVVSTLNAKGLPESAVVGFGITDKFELIFGTSAGSRKAHNIPNNGAVAVVIGWDEQGTVQYEGNARMLSGDEIDPYAEIYYAKEPEARAYRDDPDERFFVIAPTWLRYTDVTSFPWKTTELTF